VPRFALQPRMLRERIRIRAPPINNPSPAILLLHESSFSTKLFVFASKPQTTTMAYASDNLALNDMDIDLDFLEGLSRSGSFSNTSSSSRSSSLTSKTMLITAAIDFDLPPSYHGATPLDDNASLHTGPYDMSLNYHGITSLDDNASLHTGPSDISTNAVSDVPLANSTIYTNRPFDNNFWYDAGLSSVNASAAAYKEPNAYQ
jgi:hypothetical protein